jgi:hypothetical protein
MNIRSWISCMWVLIATLLIFATGSATGSCQAVQAQHPAQAQIPVRWTRAVGPPSRQALRAKLLKPPARKPRSKKIYFGHETGREIRTCVDYLRALKHGWGGSGNTYEQDIESFFKDECDVMWLVLAAKPSRVSYVRGFKLDESALDLLPPTLSFNLFAEQEEAADQAEHSGLSWKKYNPEMKLVGKKFNEITVDEDPSSRVILQIKAFGDFNGDGVEDVLLFRTSYLTQGTARDYTPVILTRLTPGGRFKAFAVDDKAIQKAAAKVMNTGSAKPRNKAGQEHDDED